MCAINKAKNYDAVTDRIEATLRPLAEAGATVYVPTASAMFLCSATPGICGAVAELRGRFPTTMDDSLPECCSSVEVPLTDALYVMGVDRSILGTLALVAIERGGLVGV